MKATLRYLLIVAAMVSFLGAKAQELAQQPEAQMQSTSIMQGSGSTLPSAAVNGVQTTYSSPKASNGPRRGIDSGDTPPSDPHGPNEDPLGDVMWPLMLLACAYCAFLIKRTRKREAR